MPTTTWRDFVPDIEMIRQHMALNPPDDGSIVVEHDDTRVTGVSWTSARERCSVSTPIVASRPA